MTLQDCFNSYPKRSITDTLVQKFFEDVKWTGQNLDQVLFLNTYNDWWNQAPVQGLERVIFGILLLRVCCIGSAFLQVGTLTNKEILAIGTSKVATHCDQLANRIQELIQGLPVARSSMFAQIIYLNAFYQSIQGQLETAWYTLGSAIRILQLISANVNTYGVQRKEELTSEFQTRHAMFLNVLVLDSALCFFLDRPPTVSEKRFIEFQSAGVNYQTNPSLESEPGPYDERLLQAKLWKLWTAMKEEIETCSKSGSIPAQVEQRYQRLRRSFIDQLPNAFSLDHPDKQWDQQNLMLKYQRDWLHANTLMIQCSILQDSLLLGHTETAEMGHSERSMAYQHVKLLASSTLTLREVLCSIYSIFGFTKGAISILRPYATRSAILAGLSFIITRSMQASSRSSRSWPDHNPEDNLSFEACRSHIQDTLTLLRASQGVPSVESEMKSLQAILARIEQLNTSDAEISMMRNGPSPQQCYEQASIGGAIRSPDFPLASADLLDSITTFNAPQSIHSFPNAQNDDAWDSNYLSMLLSATGPGKPVQSFTTELNLDRSTSFNMPMFDTSTSNSTPSTGEQHWENSIGPIALNTTHEGILNDNGKLFI